MSHYHALVWIDHVEAHVMHISPDDVEKSLIHPSGQHHKLHSKVGTLGNGRAPEDQDYYHRVAEALSGASEILIVGPAQAKLQLIKHIHGHHPALAATDVLRRFAYRLLRTSSRSEAVAALREDWFEQGLHCLM